MLAAGALGAVGVDPDLVPVELDLDVVAGLGHDLDEGERRLPPLLCVERADPDEPVDAALGPEVAEGVAAFDLDGGALDPGLLTLLGVDHLRGKAVGLGPAQIHPQEHLRPVGRFGAARAGADREDGRPGIVLAVEEELGAGLPEVLLEAGGIAVELTIELGVAGFLDQLDEGQKLVRASQETGPQVDIGAQAVGLAEDLLGGPAVVPEVGFLGQRVEGGDPAALAVEVKAAPRSPGSGPTRSRTDAAST